MWIGPLLVRRKLRDIGVFFATAAGREIRLLHRFHAERSISRACVSFRREQTDCFGQSGAENRRGALESITNLSKRGCTRCIRAIIISALLQPLGIQDALPKLHLDLPREACAKADQLCRDNSIDHPFVIFHPGAARVGKIMGSGPLGSDYRVCAIELGLQGGH